MAGIMTLLPADAADSLAFAMDCASSRFSRP